MVIFVFSSPFLFANYEGNLKFKISDELYCRLQSLADPNKNEPEPKSSRFSELT